MPLAERERLFAAIARRGFEKDFYQHDEVFDDIRQSPFSLKEAAVYLEVADITVRRWVKDGKISYRKIGRNLVFDPDYLKAFKKKKRRKDDCQSNAVVCVLGSDNFFCAIDKRGKKKRDKHDETHPPGAYFKARNVDTRSFGQ